MPKGPARPRRHDPALPRDRPPLQPPENGDFRPKLRRLRSPSSGRHFWRSRYGNSSPLHALADGWVSRGVGYPALRQTPYVALVVPAYGEIGDMMFRLSGVGTDPIRGVGCTGVWGVM
ncbi:hypothetical protein L3X38_011034 [Prunus dulcis]|uniref:Uncharacterized protein n=1 Tax=Prunus dulcis TaxID=3755 RepID=A0AAD4WGM5_PRUDU|nr:hypothetical protein L3X38_011034 [Prunus dulcis]